jgi:DNA-binding winged helix-turn-helix (wHTH) protein
MRKLGCAADPTLGRTSLLYHFGEFSLDAARRTLFRDGQRVHLTSRPLEVLLVLVSRPGELIDKQKLLDAVWRDTAVTEDSLIQAISEIRRTLGEKTGDDRFVQTVPRQGYRFVGAVTVEVPRSQTVPEGTIPSLGRASENGEIRAAAGAVQSPSSVRSGWRRAGAAAGTLLLVLAAVALVRFSWRGSSTGQGHAAVAPGSDPAGPNLLRTLAASAYGTVHAGGVVLEIGGDANLDATARIEWRRAAESTFHRGHDLVRIDATHMAGSLFWLEPSNAYELRVTASDPDGVLGSRVFSLPLETRADPLPDPTLGVLHVSPEGRDANAGTSPATSLRTIQRAANLARAGDLVLIAPGIYRERVVVRASGTGSQPIVFRGAGSGVVLDGADARLASGVVWASVGDGVYRVESGFATGHVTSEAGRLFRYTSLEDLRTSRAGSPGGFFAAGTTLYVKFSDGRPPSVHVVHAARLDQAFVLEGVEFVGIDNLEIRHYGGAAPGVGVFLRNCLECVVRRTRIHEVQRAGIWVEGGERGRLEDNEIWDTSIAEWPWHQSNLSSADNHGIFFDRVGPRGFLIRRNHVWGLFDGIAPCGSLPPTGGVTTETDLYDNLIDDVLDDGVEAEPYCANLRMWGNRVRGGLMAFSVAPAAPGPIWIVRNVAFGYGASRARSVWLASALKINSGYEVTTGPILVYHNTFVTDVPGVDGVALLPPGRVVSIVARNNLIAGTRYALFKENPLPWNGDGNAYYSADSSRLVHWEGRSFATLSEWAAALGQEPHGSVGAPLLIDPGGDNFEPGPGSPLVDRGLPLPGINDRYLGQAPDIGAVESEAKPSGPPRSQ